VGERQFRETLEKQDELEKVAQKLNLPFFYVEKYHSKETGKFLKELDADLGILYGTNIIRKSVFEIPRLGSINIHQGLAPLYRGGPTVFWELFNGEKQIGITVHFVAPKVDTGDLILQKTLPLEYDFQKYDLDYERFLEDFRRSLIEPSSNMMAEAIEQIARGNFQRTKQDISLGKRYRLPVKREKDELVKILKKRREAQKKLHNSFA
jgi:methionyl-tRNA formyltransferase